MKEKAKKKEEQSCFCGSFVLAVCCRVLKCSLLKVDIIFWEDFKNVKQQVGMS